MSKLPEEIYYKSRKKLQPPEAKYILHAKFQSFFDYFET